MIPLLLGTTPTPTDEQLGELIDSGLSGGDWLRAGTIVVGAIVVAAILSRLARAALGRAMGAGFAPIVTARLLGYAVFLVGLVYALNSLGVRVGPLLGALGLGGLVIALALQKVVENFVGALIIQARRPFTVGDTITISEHTGVVADVDARTTVLHALDGSIVRIPNIDVLTSPIVNLTRRPTRRSELAVGVAYAADLEQAVEVIREAVASVPGIHPAPAPTVRLMEFGASSVDLAVYFWHDSDIASEFATRHELIVQVHRRLGAAGISIPFPQMVVWPSPDAAADATGDD